MNTHLHFDHILGNAFVENTYAVGSQAHKDDLFLLNQLPLHAQLFGVTAREICRQPVALLKDGDLVHCGNFTLKAIHSPGHSPGSIGLWEASSGTLFSGDALHDGPLLDQFDDANIADYINTMLRLRELPVNVVHGGHDRSFGRERMRELIDAYLRSKGAL